MKVNSQILIVALLMVLCLNLSRIYAQPYSISSTEIIIFRDGVAQVIQSLDVDESLVSISIPLLSHSVWNLLVLDEDNMPLSYTIKLPNITITTLGASKVTLDYFTPTLTQKEGEVWTIKLNLPYEVKIILPERSNIIYLNDLPSSITARDQRIVLTVPPGFWEISYVLPPMIPLPPSTPSPPSTLPPTPTPTPTPAPTPTPPTPPTPTPTPTPKPTTPSTIEETKIVQPPFIEYIITITVISSLIGILLFLRGRGEAKVLRSEDKEVLRFIAEKGGKVLESEIRQKFLLPKSTTWRLVKRLERMGYVRINKVGIQNEVELVKRL